MWLLRAGLMGDAGAAVQLPLGARLHPTAATASVIDRHAPATQHTAHLEGQNVHWGAQIRRVLARNRKVARVLVHDAQSASSVLRAEAVSCRELSGLAQVAHTLSGDHVGARPARTCVRASRVHLSMLQAERMHPDAPPCVIPPCTHHKLQSRRHAHAARGAVAERGRGAAARRQRRTRRAAAAHSGAAAAGAMLRGDGRRLRNRRGRNGRVR